MLAEKEPGSLCDAMDREGAALSQVDVVQIQLEDFVLRCAPFQDERHERLAQLPPVRPSPFHQFCVELVGQKEHACELLRDGAVAHQVRVVAEDVGHRSRGDPHRIDAGVGVEALVFNRKYRLLHVGGDGR